MVGDSAFRGNNQMVWFTCSVVFLTMVGVRNQKSMVVSDCFFLLVVYMNVFFKLGPVKKNFAYKWLISLHDHWRFVLVASLGHSEKSMETLPITFPPQKKIGPESLRKILPEKFALSFRSEKRFLILSNHDLYENMAVYTTATGVGSCPWIVWVPKKLIMTRFGSEFFARIEVFFFCREGLVIIHKIKITWI